MDSLVFLRIVFLLCWFQIQIVETFSFYGRGNVLHQNPFSDISSTFSSGKMWQDQPYLDPPPPFYTGNDWQQNPTLDYSSSFSSGNVWRNQPPWNTPSPYVSESIWQQEPDPYVSSKSGNEWHQWAPDHRPSTRQPGKELLYQ
ncbi:uncharacterized protein [Magallana gigas]|uniref:uncharacterized protein n=1 Tax=Magallana gigas TaxID=29159 RepID=UPI003341CD98